MLGSSTWNLNVSFERVMIKMPQETVVTADSCRRGIEDGHQSTTISAILSQQPS